MALIRYRLTNVVNVVRVVRIDEDRELAVLNPSAWNERREVLVQRAGGGAILTQMGRRVLHARFGVKPDDIERVEISDPQNPEKKKEVHEVAFWADEGLLDELYGFFKERRSEYFEVMPFRELSEELTEKEYDGIAPVLTPQQLSRCIVRHEGFCLQQPRKDGYASSRHGGITRNFMHFFSLTVPQRVYDRLLQSKAVRILEPHEVDTTEGGICKGITDAGETIALNVFRPTFNLEVPRMPTITVRPPPSEAKQPILQQHPLFMRA